MLSRKNIIRLAVTFSIFCWVAMVFSDLTILFSNTNDIDPGILPEFPDLFLALYVLSLFVFFKFKIEKAESVNFIDLLWRVFVTGLLTTIGSLGLRSFGMLIGNTRLASNYLVSELIFLINIGLVTAFVVSTLIVWKRLILYQKSKFLLKAWVTFEYLLFGSLLLEFIPGSITQYFTVVLIVVGVTLSFNMKWVAYLNFKQKWKSILLVLLILLYLGYFYIHLTGILEANELITLGRDHVFISSAFIFIFVYSIISLLVILFNLPTSSVFEQKLDEVVNFQRISQSIQTEQSEEQVYEILLDSAVSTVFADSAWIETENGGVARNYPYQISTEEISNIQKRLNRNKAKGLLKFGSSDRAITNQNLLALSDSRFRSILIYPITAQGEVAGKLVMLKEVSDGFNKDMMEISDTFVNQAGISIENFRLLSEALENERYKETLKIAKRVQVALLPEKLESTNSYEISAFSKAADEVGGDYYDTFQISPTKTAFVIGDVSGKGTSAAFNMSQMKGIFHGLVQLDLPPSEFMIRANSALSSCLEKTSFITITYLVLDQENKTLEFVRAGHCPTLIYDRSTGEVNYHVGKGLGLGVLRNNKFGDYLETSKVSYNSGDIILLYTDGITEAMNGRREEFGQERLKEFIRTAVDLSVEEIQQSLLKELYKFCGTDIVNDDYTMVTIKFK